MAKRQGSAAGVTPREVAPPAEADRPVAELIGRITTSMLVRLQLHCLFDRPFARITDGYDEARAWVLSGQKPRKLKV